MIIALGADFNKGLPSQREDGKLCTAISRADFRAKGHRGLRVVERLLLLARSIAVWGCGPLVGPGLLALPVTDGSVQCESNQAIPRTTLNLRPAEFFQGF